MATPTPKVPYVVNDDGTISVLVYQGRTFQMTITHTGLVDPSGYKARAWFKVLYGDALPLMEANSEDGSITLTALPGGAGTTIVITIPDETTATLVDKKGVYDVLLEAPGGAEFPVIPASKWYLWPGVAE